MNLTTSQDKVFSYLQEYWASTNKLNYEVIGNIYENPELIEVVE